MMANTRQDYIIHPYNIMITLVLGGITAMFLGFSCAYMYSRFQGNTPPIPLPSLFYFNSAVLLGSSLTLMAAQRSYKQDDTTGYKRWLLYTIIITFIFLVLQIIAWNQLFGNDILINHSTTASYLYVISGLHFVHVIAGLPFLIWFLWTAKKKLIEPVSVLVYFSDPHKRLSLKLITVYWHFLDALWIYLVAFFALNYLLS